MGVFAYLLFLVSSNVDGYFEGQALPDQLTARNITITLRTVVRGLSYLMTFLFAANTVGLTGKPFSPSHVPSLLLLPTQSSAMPTLAQSSAALFLVWLWYGYAPVRVSAACFALAQYVP